MLVTTLLATAVLTVAEPVQDRPEWASGGVPDTVWTLVELAAGTRENDKKRSLLREAELHAREAAATEDDLDTRYALALVLGLRANVEGGKTKVQAAADMSNELDAILAVEPGHPGARHLLGRLHAGIRRMGRFSRWWATNVMGGETLKDATWEAAEENLVYAEQNAPEVAEHHLQLALLYRDTGRPELAMDELSHVIALEPRNALDQAALEEAIKVRSELGQ